MRRVAVEALWQAATSGTGEKVRSAGPPSPFDTLVTWTAVSLIGFWCFIKLPQRLQTQHNMMTGALTTYNDFAWAGYYAFWCSYLVVAYDVCWRMACLVMLSPELLVKMQFVVSSKPVTLPGGVVIAVTDANNTSPGTLTANILPDMLVSACDVLRELLGLGSLFVSDAAESLGGSPVQEGDPLSTVSTQGRVTGYWRHVHVVVLLTTAFTVVVVWATYHFHVSKYRKGTLPEQHQLMKDPRTGEISAVPAQYRGRVLVIPMLTWMALWTLAFTTAFAYVKAMPLLTGIVFPTLTGVLLAYSVIIP